MRLNPPLQDWHDQVVWIIGASTGIGAATAHQLHAQGARVIVSARDQAGLDRFVREHPGALAIALDVTREDTMKAALEQVLASFGRIDLVAYSAGYYQEMGAADFDLDIARRHLAVNFEGALILLSLLLPVMLRQGRGHLSLIASVAGYRGLPKAMAYGPTKAALQHLADNLYLDLHPRGIGVSVINPGFVDTPLTAGNTFTMPALISPEQAATQILEGWRQGRFEIHFPRRFSNWLKLLSHLPHRAYFAAVKMATGT